jgi:uncharacterized protein (DUF2062 family)
MRAMLKRWLTAPSSNRKALRLPAWLPFPRDPRLLALRRRSVALGAGIGALASVIPLPIQIPIAVLTAVWLRAHVAVAAASTLVSNPLTIVPMWAAAWKIGTALTGDPEGAPPGQWAIGFDRDLLTWVGLADALSTVGPPLLIGLVVLGAALALTAYALVMIGWRFGVLWRRRRGQTVRAFQ